MYNKKLFDNDNRPFQIMIYPCAKMKDENCEVKVPTGHCSTKSTTPADASPMAVATVASIPVAAALVRLHPVAAAFVAAAPVAAFPLASYPAAAPVADAPLRGTPAAVPLLTANHLLTAVPVAATSPIAAAQEAAFSVAAAPLLGHHTIYMTKFLVTI
jgi:hypothetical protein